MNTLYQYLQSVWNFEYTKFKPAHLKIAFGFALFFGLIYVVGEVIFGKVDVLSQYTILNFQKDIRSYTWPAGHLSLESIFPIVWITLAILVLVVRYSVIIASFFKTRKVFGDAAFTQNFLTYFFAAQVSLWLSLLVVLICTKLASLMGFHISAGLNLFEHGAKALTASMNRLIPTIINVHSYWLAIVLTILLTRLPDFILHYGSHRSRLLWYVFHRAHHCPEILYPLGAPVAFAFDFLLAIPYTLVAIGISKLIYTQPLVMEMTIWFSFYYFVEIFNHSSVHYDFVYSNPIVRNLCRLIGNTGVYHIMHHSALEQDQNILFSGAPFNFWDRVFGTYRKPYKTIPPLGLTNQPRIIMNPFRIVFSGIYQLSYELRHNTAWSIRWRIVFGSVYYKPPVTKDFLIVA